MSLKFDFLPIWRYKSKKLNKNPLKLALSIEIKISQKFKKCSFHKFDRRFTLKMCPKTAAAHRIWFANLLNFPKITLLQYCMGYLSKQTCIKLFHSTKGINVFKGHWTFWQSNKYSISSIVTSTFFSYNQFRSRQQGRFPFSF